MLSRIFGSKIAQVTVFITYFALTFIQRFGTFYILNFHTRHPVSFQELKQLMVLQLIADSTIILVFATLIQALILFYFVRCNLQADWRINLVATLRITSLNFAIVATIIAVLLANLILGMFFRYLYVLISLVVSPWIIGALILVLTKSRILQNYQVKLGKISTKRFGATIQMVSVIMSITIALYWLKGNLF